MSHRTWQFEDLLAADCDAADSYFDPSEFETRRELEDTHYWHVHRRALILQFLRRACRDPRRKLVELGCGVGTVATYLNAHGYDVDYADVHAEGLRAAYARACAQLGAGVERHRFVRLDLTRQLPPHPYAGVLLLDVLEHLPDDAAVMRNLHRYLRSSAPDAFLFLTVPAFPFLWSPWDDLERHKRRYTASSLRRLATATGYAIEHLTYFFLPLFFAALGVKALRRLRQVVQPGARQSPGISAMAEARNHPALNRIVLGALAPERLWLRDARCPLGTSLVCVARPA